MNTEEEIIKKTLEWLRPNLKKVENQDRALLLGLLTLLVDKKIISAKEVIKIQETGEAIIWAKWEKEVSNATPEELEQFKNTIQLEEFAVATGAKSNE